MGLEAREEVQKIMGHQAEVEKSSLAYNDTKKRELESNLTISETHVLNHPFMPKKKKGNFFPDGNSRGTLLARAALNHMASVKPCFLKMHLKVSLKTWSEYHRVSNLKS